MFIFKFDHDNIKEVRAKIEEALEKIGDDYGLKFELGNIRFGEDDFTATIKSNVYISEEFNEERTREKFERNASLIGIPKDALNKSFKGLDGKTYQITGLNMRASKNRIEITDVKTGTRYRCPKSFLKF